VKDIKNKMSFINHYRTGIEVLQYANWEHFNMQSPVSLEGGTSALVAGSITNLAFSYPSFSLCFQDD
jgi:hypothetical protein